MEFHDWIEEKYIEWRGKTRRSVLEFAKDLGVPQSLMSQWMRPGGKVPKSKKYIDLLISRYGEEVYGVLGIKKEGISALFPQLMPKVRQKLSGFIEDFSAMAQGIDEDDEKELARVVDEALRKNGIERRNP